MTRSCQQALPQAGGNRHSSSQNQDGQIATQEESPAPTTDVSRSAYGDDPRGQGQRKGTDSSSGDAMSVDAAVSERPLFMELIFTGLHLIGALKQIQCGCGINGWPIKTSYRVVFQPELDSSASFAGL